MVEGTSTLYLGNYEATRDMALLGRRKITAVITVCREV
jgi:hypothetical protein